MASSIDSAKPVSGSPTTSSVRDNFQHAQSEINRLLRSSEEFRTNTGSVNALAADFGVAAVNLVDHHLRALIGHHDGLAPCSHVLRLGHHLGGRTRRRDIGVLLLITGHDAVGHAR